MRLYGIFSEKSSGRNQKSEKSEKRRHLHLLRKAAVLARRKTDT
jgi:hypothetical protein